MSKKEEVGVYAIENLWMPSFYRLDHSYELLGKKIQEAEE